MRRNPERRVALVDAAVEVLARDGARGLTFRAVDTEAKVPAGTASNYFANRGDLLEQVGQQVHKRLGPGAEELAELLAAPPGRALLLQALKSLYWRIVRDSAGYLALIELRLEAVRRPEVRETLTRTIRLNRDSDAEFKRTKGLPGDEKSAILLYFALSGMLVEHLTLPGVMEPYDPDELIETLVDRLIPEQERSVP